MSVQDWTCGNCGGSHPTGTCIPPAPIHPQTCGVCRSTNLGCLDCAKLEIANLKRCIATEERNVEAVYNEKKALLLQIQGLRILLTQAKDKLSELRHWGGKPWHQEVDAAIGHTSEKPNDDLQRLRELNDSQASAGVAKVREDLKDLEKLTDEAKSCDGKKCCKHGDQETTECCVHG